MLKRFKFALKATKLGRRCTVTLNKESGWPEENEGYSRCHGVSTRLFVLYTGHRGDASGNTLGLGADLLAGEVLVLQVRHVLWLDIVR